MIWLLYLLCILASLAIGAWVYLQDRKREIPYPWLTAALRVLLFLAVFFLILAPQSLVTRNFSEKPLLVFLQDNSQSVREALGPDTAAYRRDLEQLRQKLGADYRLVVKKFGSEVSADTPLTLREPVTDISGALQYVRDQYSQPPPAAVILATDGRYNAGENPAAYAAGFPLTIYTVAIGDTARQKDLRIGNVQANRVVRKNSVFDIRADLIADRCSGYSGRVSITENGSPLNAQELRIETDAFDRTVSFTLHAETPGMHHYIVAIEPAAGERNGVNNRRDVFVEVAETQKKVLLLASAPDPDINAWKEALPEESYQLTVRFANEGPVSADPYSLVILHNPGPDMLGYIRTLRKPILLIGGAQTRASLYQTVMMEAVSNESTEDQYPAIGNALTAFAVPATARAVMDKLPPMRSTFNGPLTRPDAQVVVAQRGGNSPLWWLLAGPVPRAAISGSGLWRWRLYEYRFFGSHNVVDELMRQTADFLTAGNSGKSFQVRFLKYRWNEQEPVGADAILLNANGEPVNTPEVQFELRDSSGRKERLTMERTGSTYHINLGPRMAGTYNWTAALQYGGKNESASGSFQVEHTPLEFLQSGADAPLLYQLAGSHQGAFLLRSRMGALYDSIRANPAIKPVIRTETSLEPWIDRKWIFFLILLLGVAEWLMRKYWLAQ